MSRSALLLGLVLSVALHVWLLTRPAPVPSAPALPSVIPVPVVATPPPEPVPDVPNAAPEPVEVAAAPPPQPPAPEPDPPTPSPSPPVPPPAPAPRLVETAPPVRNEEPARGDLAGSPEGRPAPVIRINWGTELEALRTVQAGGMKIVVLEGPPEAPRITAEISRDDHGWRRGGYRSIERFSNRLRIVDDVPAFGNLRRATDVRRPQRLAILVPPAVERKLEAAQLEAAFRAGITLEQIRHVAGRFTVEEGGLGFQVISLGRR